MKRVLMAVAVILLHPLPDPNKPGNATVADFAGAVNGARMGTVVITP